MNLAHSGSKIIAYVLVAFFFQGSIALAHFIFQLNPSTTYQTYANEPPVDERPPVVFQDDNTEFMPVTYPDYRTEREKQQDQIVLKSHLEKLGSTLGNALLEIFESSTPEKFRFIMIHGGIANEAHHNSIVRLEKYSDSQLWKVFHAQFNRTVTPDEFYKILMRASRVLFAYDATLAKYNKVTPTNFDTMLEERYKYSQLEYSGLGPVHRAESRLRGIMEYYRNPHGNIPLRANLSPTPRKLCKRVYIK